MDIDRRKQLYVTAEHQYGLFTADQARSIGVTPRQLRAEVEAARLVRRSRRVLMVAGAPSSFEQTLMAACLHQEYTSASHTASGRLHRFRYVRRPIVEVTTQYPCGSRNPFGRVHRSVDLRSEDLVWVGPIPATSVARTAADLVCTLPRRLAERQIDDLLLTDRMTLAELWAVHTRFARQGRPGTVALREILEARDDAFVPPHSDLEQDFLELARVNGLPEPDRQVPLPGWSDHPTRVDFAYPWARLVVEVDGRRFHGDRQQFEVDRQRDNAAQLAGWVVLRFTWRLLQDDPDYVIRTVRQALLRAAA